MPIDFTLEEEKYKKDIILDEALKNENNSKPF